MPRALVTTALCGLMAATTAQAPAAAQDRSVTTYHGHPDRSGHYIVPRLTWDRARMTHLDEDFHAEVAGHVYAQPLYWYPAGASTPLLIVATEDDNIYALNAETGAEVWKRSLGTAVQRSQLPCGNIDPEGVTGTPTIDERSQTVYLDAMVSEPGGRGPQHLVFALALRDGSVISGWPVNVSDALRAKGLRFTPQEQNERGALLVKGDFVYVPYGGNWGDCGQYHGWVIGISIHHPSTIHAWSTRAALGGVWAVGGVVADERSLYATTGNTGNASSWGDGEAIIRLSPDLQNSRESKDFFAPANWLALDNRDADLGGVAPLPLSLRTTVGPSDVIIGLGKDGKAYLADRRNLGGIGGELASQQVADHGIITGPATWRGTHGVFVAFPGAGSACPPSAAGNGLVTLEVTPGARPTIRTVWCAPLNGRGAPIVTTSDSLSNPIVWITGAQGDDHLYAFRGDTGEELLDTSQSPALQGLRRFGTILAAGHHLYVAADGRVFAFSF